MGSRYRLEIATWIWEFGGTPINPTDLTRRLQTASEAAPAHSSVVQELEKLAKCGLLVPLHAPGRDVYFERCESVFYDLCRRLRDEIRLAGSPGRHESPDPASP
jgi:hypothetical protein